MSELEMTRKVKDAAMDELKKARERIAELEATLKQAREALIKSRGLCSVKQASIHVAAAIAAIDKVQP